MAPRVRHVRRNWGRDGNVGGCRAGKLYKERAREPLMSTGGLSNETGHFGHESYHAWCEPWQFTHFITTVNLFARGVLRSTVMGAGINVALKEFRSIRLTASAEIRWVQVESYGKVVYGSSMNGFRTGTHPPSNILGRTLPCRMEPTLWILKFQEGVTSCRGTCRGTWHTVTFVRRDDGVNS